MASPTRIGYGNNLITPIAQPGWQVEADGFGLLQAQVKFKWTNSQITNFTTVFAKGTTFQSLVGEIAPSNLSQLRVWKANYVYEKADTITVTADFCGIDPSVNSGTKTITQVVMSGSTASEPIEHHPNFLVVNSPTGLPPMNKVLAGFPPASGWDKEITTNPNRALWTPKVVSGGAIQGQQFVGFLPNQEISEYEAGNINIKAGIKNYYKPANTLRCLFYVNNEATAVAFASYVGWNTNGNLYGLPDSYKGLATGQYGGSFLYTALYLSKINRGFLITSCSVEQFGGIWKVTADLMLSGISGWDPDIYPQIAGF
jgi:hypothetical protein